MKKRQEALVLRKEQLPLWLQNLALNKVAKKKGSVAYLLFDLVPL